MLAAADLRCHAALMPRHATILPAAASSHYYAADA